MKKLFRLLALFVVLVTSVNSAWAWYSFTSGKTIYYDNHITQWNNIYLRVGKYGNNGNSNDAYQITDLVAGTKYLYSYTLPSYNEYELFYFANNAGWTGSNPVDQPYIEDGVNKPNDSWAITGRTEYFKWSLDEMRTFEPNSKGGTYAGADWYNVTVHYNAVDIYTVSIVTPTNGTISVTKFNGSSYDAFSSGSSVKPTQIMKIIASPNSGYELTNLSVDGATQIDGGDTYYVTGNTTIEASFAPTYTVSIDKNNNSYGSVNVSSVEAGSVTHPTITATPNTNFIFLDWGCTSGVSVDVSSSSVNGSTATVTATADGTITANFADQYAIAGIAATGTTADWSNFRGLPNTGTNTYSKTYTLAEGNYSFKVVDRKNSVWYTAGSVTVNRANPSKTANIEGGEGNHMTLNVDLAGDYTFTFNSNTKALTITYPTYTEALSSMTVTKAGSNICGGDGSTSDKAWKIYTSQVASANLTMTVLPTSSSQGGTIKYAVNSTEKGTATSPQTITASSLSLSTTPTLYTFSAYFKKGSYKSTGAEQTVSYYIQKTSDPIVTLATKIGGSAATNADLGESPTITLEASVANNLVTANSNFTYYVKIPGAADWSVVTSDGSASATYTPDTVGVHQFKVKWTHTQDWESDAVDFELWKNYTIYVWDPDNYAKRVHIYNGSGSVHAWSSTDERMASLSSTWGTGWYSFSIQYPTYNKIKVHLDSDSPDVNAQSVEYTFTNEPLESHNNVYLRCTYKASENWLLAGGIAHPELPEVTITEVNVYATKMVVTVAIDNHYSLLTTHSITINGVAMDGSRTGDITNVGGGTYTYTLTGLTDNTDYTFHVVATNGVGTTNKSEVITTLAKMPIKYMIKVSSGLMSGAYWGANSKTTIKVKYENAETGISGTDEVSRKKADEHWWWYEYTFEDSPISFFVCNANSDPSSGSLGANRSVEISGADANSCTEVINETETGTSYHKVREPENGLCGVYYYLKYNNGAKTYISNRINSASDKMSIFIGAYNGGSPGGRSLKLCKYTTGWDETEIFSTVNPTDSAVYVISFVGEDFEASTSVSDWSFTKYTRDYYIRTDHAPGGRTNYRGNTNKMQYSDYAANVTGSTFDHYFCKWVQGASDDKRNVSFTVANEYNDNLLKTPSEDSYYVSDDYATGDGYLKQNASVRFMYDSRKNNLSRAYLSGSSSQSDYFLVLKGNESNHLYTKADKSATHSTNGTADWAFFGDNNNWIYEVDVYAVPGTRVKLTAQMKDKNNANKTQSFLGDDSNVSFDAAYTHLLIGGTGSDAYQMRVIYDFKTNRLMTAWIPTELTGNLAINADVMLVREGQEEAAQITLNSHDLTNVHTVYAVMQFNRWKLNNRANPEDMTVEHCASEEGTNNWVYSESVTNEHHPVIAEGNSGWLSRYERDLYWISFPFDVNLNEVFGSVGTYGTHWIIEYYDGKGRAQNGFWVDSEPNWKFITNVNTTLKAYEGYILALDLDYFAYNNTTTWASNIQQVELYFPSGSSSASPISIKTDNVDVDIVQTGYECSIQRDKRYIKDSYWHCIGTPSFADVTHNINTGWTTDQGENSSVVDAGDYPNRTDWTSKDLPYLYEWNPEDNTLIPVNRANYEFKAMWSYLVQYNRDTIRWEQIPTTSVTAVAARMTELPDRNFNLVLKLNDEEQDHTYVRLTDDANVSTAFEFNYDLCKEKNGGKGNIWTVTSDDIEVAGNSQPHPLTTTIVPVGVKIAANGEYTFSMPEGTNGGDVWLIDNVNSSRTNLGLMDYTVNLTTGTYEGRFSLEFPVQNVVTDIENAANANANANTEARKVFIGGRLYILRDGKTYDATGAQVR